MPLVEQFLLVEQCPGIEMNNTMICKDGKGFLLTTETAKSIYWQLIDSIKKPYDYQKKFAIASNNTKLELAFIELRREISSSFIQSMYNIAHIYGGKDVAFSIVCHIDILPILEEILGNHWENVRLIPQGDTGQVMTINDYNIMLTNQQFWNNFNSNFVLITHIDSVIFRPVDDWMFDYDILGAPWPWGAVGNGGYTLRNVSVMKSTVKNFNYSKELNQPEDVWFHDHLKNVPSVDIALKFAVEEVFDKNNTVPTGGHQLFKFGNAFVQNGNAFRVLQRFCNPI